MVKAMARRDDGTYFIILGISETNVSRLRADEPIFFDPTMLRIPAGATISGITLFYGPDDDDLTRTLKALIGLQTEVIVVPRGDEAQKQ